MTFSRVKPLGWAWGETLASADMNSLDLDHSRALDGHAGGAYNPTAAIVINNQLEVDATGAAAANVVGIIATGKGTRQGVHSTGGATSGPGVFGTGGAPDGEGLIGTGVGAGTGVIGTGGPTNGVGLLGIGTGTGIGVVGTGGVGGAIGGDFTGSGALQGVKGTGGGTDGTGVTGTGGATDGRGGSFTGAGGGHGVLATGGATSGLGIMAVGKGVGAGAQGVGGLANGIGVIGIGKGTADGMQGSGGATSGTGVHGFGGAPDGTGVKGEGDGDGAGVHGIGGDTDAYGGVFSGGTTNGTGVYAAGTGTGDAIALRRTTGAHINMQPVAGDPAAPAAGDIWAESGDDEIVAYMDGAKHQLLGTWVHGTTDGAGAVAADDENNVTSIAISATTVTVTLDRNFTNAIYAVTVTVHAAFVAFAVVTGQAVGTFDFKIYDDAGILQNPQAVAFSFGAIAKGKFA